MTYEEIKEYLDEAIAAFEADPADDDFQRGFLAALQAVRGDLRKTVLQGDHAKWRERLQ